MQLDLSLNILNLGLGDRVSRGGIVAGKSTARWNTNTGLGCHENTGRR